MSKKIRIIVDDKEAAEILKTWDFSALGDVEVKGMKFSLGERARDKVTGFEGVATCYMYHLTGCDTYVLCPLAKDGNELHDSRSFDEGRLDYVDEGINIPRETEDGRRGSDNFKLTTVGRDT